MEALVKSAGHYALLQANGMPFAELVKMIRDEQAQYLRGRNGLDRKILSRQAVDGTEDYTEWAVYTKAEGATSE